MRIDLESGFRPLQKIVGRVVQLAAGRIPGPIVVMSYRSEIYGKQMSACFQEAMRRSTQWTVGEVEIFAAFVSRLNQCAY